MLSPITISALKYLYKIENKKKLSSIEKQDLVSVKASLMPLTTEKNLSDKDKKEIIKSLNNKG